MHKPILITLLFGIACAQSQERAAVWQPSPGYMQVPIWPGAVPAALPHPKPESVGPPAGREWWPRANDVSRPTMTEMHLYAQGGHAFGVRPTKLPIGRWPALVEQWLHTIGVLSEGG